MKDLVYEVYLLDINYCGQITDRALLGKVRNYYVADGIAKAMLELDLHREMILIVNTTEQDAKKKLEELEEPLKRIDLLHKLEKGEHII